MQKPRPVTTSFKVAPQRTDPNQEFLRSSKMQMPERPIAADPFETTSIDDFAALRKAAAPAVKSAPTEPADLRQLDDPPRTLDERFRRLDLPSKGVPYKSPDVFARPIGWVEYAAIQAAIQARSTTALLDALAPTVSVPVRSLVVADYRYLLYWHRLNSFLRTPLTVSWQSIYGNVGSASLQSTTLTDTKLKMSADEYSAWRKRGFCLPCARDIEFFEHLAQANVPPEEEFLLTNAQFIDPEYPPAAACIAEVAEDHPYRSLQGRMEYLRKQPDLTIGYALKEFNEAVGDFGISESVKLTTDAFKPSEAVTYLASLLQAETAAPGSIEPDLLARIKSEHERISSAIATNRPVTALAEEVKLNFSAWAMFPAVL